MEIKERFDSFIRYNGLSRRKFQDAIGVSNSYIQNISKGISNDILNRISIQYPELNTNWLLTGAGEMLKSEERSKKTISVNQTVISTKQREGALIYNIDATCGLNGRDIEFTDEKVIGSIDAPEINPDYDDIDLPKREIIHLFIVENILSIKNIL